MAERTTAEKRERLREIIESDDIAISPGIFDGISAKFVESAGFEMAGISGAGISNSRLGKPDVGFLDVSENAAHSGMIADAVDIPVVADADTGYGNAVNVYHTVEKLDKAGVSGIMLEDQEWPKRCGHMAGKSVIPTDDMVRKIEAALDARSDDNLLIRARTDAAEPLGLEEAVNRLNVYADAGADFLIADALLTREDIEFACRETDAPLCINMGYGIKKRPTTPLISAKELEEIGAGLVAYPRLITGAAVKGMQNGFEALRESIESGEVVERPELTVGFEEYTELIGLPEIKKLEDRYATEP